jgi:glycosyltransferase involved in cell wall biosynthesis
MAKPLVSIIIPCYNYGQYLGEAIDSALAQTYPNIEIVVVNDGSTDNSASVARSYGKKISYIYQKNSGPVAAFNTGVAASKGEYFCILGADDVLDIEFIARLITPLLERDDQGLAFSYCDYLMFNGEVKIFKARPWHPLAELYRNYILATALTKRSSYEAVGGYSQYMNAKVSFEDWDFWVKLIAKGYRGIYVPGIYFHYRIHGKGRNVAGAKRAGELTKEVIAHNREVYNRWDWQVYYFFRHSFERIKNKVRTKILGWEPSYPI